MTQHISLQYFDKCVYKKSLDSLSLKHHIALHDVATFQLTRFLSSQTYVEHLLETGGPPRLVGIPGPSTGSSTPADTDTTTSGLNGIEAKLKQYYKFCVIPFTFIKIRFDRLALLALLDR